MCRAGGRGLPVPARVTQALVVCWAGNGPGAELQPPMRCPWSFSHPWCVHGCPSLVSLGPSTGEGHFPMAGTAETLCFERQRVLKISCVGTNQVTTVVKVQPRNFYLLFILFRKCSHLSGHLTSLVLPGHVDREAAAAKPGSGWACFQCLQGINNNGAMSCQAAAPHSHGAALGLSSPMFLRAGLSRAG